MYAVECKLIRKEYETDNIGVQKERETEVIIPISRTRSIKMQEFYEANLQGLKPTIKLITSALNYNNEDELEYMNERYTIIRTDSYNIDEIQLTCQRKLKDGNRG
mgnify:FL=1|nr:MAG TPA: head closure knob [Caudoviricetes sp.]